MDGITTTLMISSVGGHARGQPVARRRHHERLDDHSSRVSQMASITRATTAMLPQGGWCQHEALKVDVDNLLEPL